MNIERATELTRGWYYVREDGHVERRRPLLGLTFYDEDDLAQFVELNFGYEGTSDARALADAVRYAEEGVVLDAIDECVGEYLQSAGDFFHAVLRSTEDVLGVRR